MSRNQPPGERAALPTTLAHERACARTRARGGAREKRREKKRTRWHEKEEGVGALRRRRQGKVVVRGRTRSARPPSGFLSLSLSLVESTPPILRPLSLFFSVSRRGPRVAFRRGQNLGHGPRATGHAGLPDTTSSTRRHATVTFSSPLLILVPSLSVCFSFSYIFSLSFSLSLLHSLYTHDAYDRARSRHGRWQRVRGT